MFLFLSDIMFSLVLVCLCFADRKCSKNVKYATGRIIKNTVNIIIRTIPASKTSNNIENLYPVIMYINSKSELVLISGIIYFDVIS